MDKLTKALNKNNQLRIETQSANQAIDGRLTAVSLEFREDFIRRPVF